MGHRHDPHYTAGRVAGIGLSAGPEGDPCPQIRDQQTVAAISRGSRDAFVLLFDRTSDAVHAEIASRLDPNRAATVFASTYLEVWWLAGCHSGPEIGATEWIKNILRRRIADADLDTRKQSSTPVMASDPSPDLRPSCAELELAFLLGRPVARWWPA